jgi:hypothetical protein
MTLSRRHKGKKAAYVRPIKASDERTLENAILMANQLASKSMQDLDKRCTVDDMFNASPQESPLTPNSSTKKFTFKFPATSSGGGGKHRSTSPPSTKSGSASSSSKHHHHHFSDEVNARTDLESMITPTARDAYRSLIEGGGGEKSDLFGSSKADALGKVEPTTHYRSETLTTTKTFATTSPTHHRLSLPPSAAAFTKLELHQSIDNSSNSITEPAAANPLPLPPKDRKSSVTAGGKRHVRKNPLIIPSGAAASMARRAEDLTGKFLKTEPFLYFLFFYVPVLSY